MVIYHLKGRIITRQGIAHPLAVSATLPAVSPVFVSYSPGTLCRTAPPTLSPVPFLSCLRLIETAPNDGHISYRKDNHYHIETRVSFRKVYHLKIIIPKRRSFHFIAEIHMKL